MIKKSSVGVCLLVVGIVFCALPFVSGMFSLNNTLSVQIVDNDGEGIEGATVYVFDNKLGHPEEALCSGVTDVDGIVSISNLTGFLSVGVVAEGYSSERAIVIYPEMETEVSYAYYGACGVVDFMHVIMLDAPNDSPNNLVFGVSDLISFPLNMIFGACFFVPGAILIIYEKKYGSD